MLPAILVLLSLCLAGCVQDVFEEPVDGPVEEPAEGPIGGDFHADPIYGVFYDDETGEKNTVIIGRHNYYGDTAIEELADALSWFTGLNFAVSATYDDLGTAVEWLPEATIFDAEAASALLYNDEGSDKTEHRFADNAALRWFMLDSLAETLSDRADGLHYTMDGGKDLVLIALTPVDTFPADALYEGRPAQGGQG